MQTVDLINSFFEGTGTVLAWMNVFRIMQDKSVRGTHWQSMIFWSVWGWWNIAYYATIGHWLSLAATSGLVLANCLWVVLAYRYSRGE